MKKVLLGLLVLFSVCSFGQSKMRIGANSGLTYSKFRGNAMAENHNAGLGFMAGLSFEYYLKDRLSLITNASFEQKTSTDKVQYTTYDPSGDYAEVNAKVRTTYNYITLPILIKYNFGKENSFFVNGGPFVGLLLNSKFSSNLDNDDLDTTDMNRKSDFGLSVGLGKRIILNDKNDLNIEIRENLGLANTSKVDVINDGTIKTNSLNLIVGWSFGI